MSVAVTHVLRKPPILKTVSTLVLAAFLSLSLQPLALAATASKTNPVQPPQVTAPGEGAAMARTLDSVHGKLATVERKLARSERHGEDLADLRNLRRNLTDQDRATLQSFNRIGQQLKDKHLPQVILDRHDQAVKTYKAEFATTLGHLDAIDRTNDNATRHARTKAAMQYLAEKQGKKPKQKFDPNDLPTHPFAPNKKNVPKRSKTEFQKAGLASNPLVRLAALGDFRFDLLPGASDPAYLAATSEVVLTDAIKAKAQSLNYDPVKIHNWVRNNVEWLPTFGATQDADVTLGSQRGNAMDIASLEIALLRAALIPARYVYGTIEVPAGKFMNWAGGFTNINAALDYASSGGIPVTGVVSAGNITKVQLEHVWVEAAIDFQPSRGAINKSADSWIQLDPSYKQYQDLPGLDVVAISGLDPNALAQSFATSSTVNDAEGWVQNLNPTILTSAQTQAQTALQTYIQNNLTNPTVGDVLGGRKVIATTTTVLPASLPYRSVVTGARYGSLPAGLQNAMTFAFGLDPLGEPINPVTYPWAQLNNHKVTLSFKPATSADEQALAALLPPGPITDPSQLPSSIPAYLIHVIPELAIDGQTTMQGSPMTLGTDLNFFYGITRLNPNQSQTYTYAVTAGSYLSVGVAGGSVSPSKLQELKAKLTQTLTTIQSGNAAAIGTLTQEDILGDMFYAGTLGYFGQFIALSQVSSISQKVSHNLPMGYGTLGYEPNVRSLFGIPRAITPGGIGVNVRIGQVVASLDGDSGKRLALSLQAGALSSVLESGVPEQMLSTPAQPAQGVSAIKALQIASSQGQKIYHITQASQAQAMPNLHLDPLAIEEITQGLATGKEVIAHTDRISVPGWIGEGYIIYDSVTGAGAYKIAGGNNGGDLPWSDLFAFSTAGALGYVDGKIGRLAGEKFIFSDQLKYLSNLARVSQMVGAAALLVSLLNILLDDQLSASQTVGQLSLDVLGFAITTYIVEAIALLFVPPFTIIGAILVAVTMAVAISYLKAMYFSYILNRKKHAYV